MRKYKVLLTGKNNTALDDFFTRMSVNFDSLTTSVRYEDIINHLKFFAPDIFVYCMNCESSGDINKIISVKGPLEKSKIPLVIIGSEEECNDFKQYAFNIADMVLIKPITASSVESKIIEYLQEKQRLREEAERAEKERIAKENKERLAQENALRKKHILVVDDDPFMLKMIKEHLRERYDVATASSGKTALKFLEKKQTNLILLDYAMPVEDGPAVLEKLHASEATKNIPVVFLTGITERDKIQKALVQKPQGYLLKPIDHDKLIETISKLIG